jgi:hypothetical protein
MLSGAPENPSAGGISGWWRTPLDGNTGGNGATMSKLPLERTDAPGIYRRGSNYVVV